MITRDQWNQLTPQQQFDYVHLLEETVDGYVEEETENNVPPLSAEETRKYYAGMTRAQAESMSYRTGMPVEDFLPKVSRFEFNPVTGEITNKETHYLFPEHEGQGSNAPPQE